MYVPEILAPIYALHLNVIFKQEVKELVEETRTEEIIKVVKVEVEEVTVEVVKVEVVKVEVEEV
tara:strand:- start:431 stop:622 length:192 start_codon:yes stop_codon:yes gene_type:complete